MTDVKSVTPRDEPPVFFIDIKLADGKLTHWFYDDRRLRDIELQMIQERL